MHTPDDSAISDDGLAAKSSLAHLDDAGDDLSLGDLLALWARHWRWMVAAAVLAGGLAYAVTYLIQPSFSSTATIMPPQQQQSGAASALASLGALAGLAGAGSGIKSPVDQYIALMQSVTVSDRMIDQFKLIQVYDAKYRVDARKALAEHVQITSGKKDGMISVQVEDHDPRQAAAMANQYVEELRRMTSVLAVSEAQQRRLFFEKQLEDAKDRLTTAQTALQDSGFNPGALKSEPRAAADAYGRLKAELTAAEVSLQTLRGSLADGAPEVRRQASTVQALRERLADLERSNATVPTGPDYVSKYREFKYQETLFDLMAKQYELARVDEAREGALIQVVDVAMPAERKSSPKRTLIAVGAAVVMELLLGLALIVSGRRLNAPRD